MSDLDHRFPVIVDRNGDADAHLEVHEAELVDEPAPVEPDVTETTGSLESEETPTVEEAVIVEAEHAYTPTAAFADDDPADTGAFFAPKSEFEEEAEEEAEAELETEVQTAAEVASEPAAASPTPDAPQIPANPIVSMPLGKAINKGLHDALANDSKVLLMGEDIGPLGGVYRVTEGLHAEFGPQRVLDTPLAESGILGTAIGLAMRGYRPVCEIQFDGFIFPGFDQITTQIARMRNRHEGTITMPIVIRVPYGGHIGSIEHHSESPEAYFAHTPGLRVVSPSNSHDAYWMIQEAIASDDPVLFFEPKSRYFVKSEINLAENASPLHSARIARVGTDVTVVAHGAMVSTLLHAADLAAEEGKSLEVIDLRSISPIDYEPVLESVRKTGRLVVVQEAQGNVSVGSEIAATVTERAFYSLEAPVIRVSAFDTPYPPSKVEGMYLADADRVLEAVDRSLSY
jgi:2-oxoisovalerate dehydrogenase E1 component beta subunit